MSINPRQLKHLRSIAEHGSLVAAAKALNIAQPSLSVSIARLEDVVGLKLVERGRHGAQLTDAGRTLVRHATGLDRALDNALAEVQFMAQGISGPFVVGGTPLATASFIPNILSELTVQSGPLACRVVEGVEENLRAGLLAHEIDILVCTVGGSRPDNQPLVDIVSEPLFTARTSVVVRQGHPLAHSGELSVHDLRDSLWVLPPRGSTFRYFIDALFLLAGVPAPRNLIEAAPFGVLKEIIKRTDGVTILSDQIVWSELADGSLVTMQLREQMTPRQFGLQRLATRIASPLAERFMAIARRRACDFST